jgi:phage-related protein
MIQVSPALRAAIESSSNQPIDLYEIYLDSSVLRYADQAINWNGNAYAGRVRSRSAIRRSMAAEFDRVTVTFSNVDLAMASVLLNNHIEGARLVIRRVDRTVANDSIVLFDGRIERPAKIDEESAAIEAVQILGSIDQDAPGRNFSKPCVWKFKGPQCGYLGAEATCDKSWARCSQLGNTNRYGGFRFIPHGGTFQYQDVEKKRFLLLFWRKKKSTVTQAFGAVDDTPYDVPIPIVLGRTECDGITIQHVDEGNQTKALVAFCVGTVSELAYIRANNTLIADWTQHLGQPGGTGSQLVDPRFPNSYPYSHLAYAGVTIPSEVTQVDPAPTVRGLVKGSIVDLFDAAGVYAGYGWSDSPIWNTRHYMQLPLDEGGMGLPWELFDDATNHAEAAYCAGLIANPTNDQKIYQPEQLPAGIGVGDEYQRFQSTGVDGHDPMADGPYFAFSPSDNDTDTTPTVVQVARFTLNLAIQRGEKAIDVLYNKILPAFRGYITYSKDGKIQIRSERPVPGGNLSAAVAAGATSVSLPTGGISAGDRVIVGALTAAAEVGLVAAVAGNTINLASPLLNAHQVGDAVVRVDAHFADSNVIGSFEYPMSDRQQPVNRVSVKYVDAAAGFEASEIRVNDEDHQARVHRVESIDVDGSGIDSYFQAWRIGQWSLAKMRDLGRFVGFTSSIRASLHEVGDVIAVSAVECGLSAVPFRIIEMEHLDNDEVRIVGQLYSAGVYDDTAPQVTVPVPAVFPASDANTPVNPVPPANVTIVGGAWSLATPKADGTQTVLLDVEYTPPDPIGTFIGVRAFIKKPDGKFHPAGDFDYAAPGNNIVRLEDAPPDPAEDWQIFLASRSARFEVALDATGTPHIAIADIGGPLAAGGAAANGTLGAVTLSYDGLDARYQVPLTPPAPLGSYAGSMIYIDAPDRSGGSPTGWTPELIGWTKSGDTIDFKRPAPTEAEFHRIYACPGSTESDARPAIAGSAFASPSVQVLVAPPPPAGAGVEYVPRVTAFAAAATEYGSTEGGQQTWRVKLTWTWPVAGANLDLLRGVDLVREDGTNQTGLARVVIESGVSTSDWTSEWELVPPAATQYRFSAVSYDSEDRGNSLVFGVTPSATITVQRQNGAAAQEYAPLVTGVGVTATMVSISDAVNQAMVQLDVTWTAPTDSRYGGAVCVIDKGGVRKEVGGAAISPYQKFEPAPPTFQSWIVYVVTVDTNGRRNSVVPGTTPSVTVNVGSVAGQINLLRAINFGAEFTAGAQFAIATSGIGQTKIQAGAIDTLRLTTGNLDVGGGGSKPSQFRVFDFFNSMIGWIGQDGGFVGGWFKQIYIGGANAFGAQIQSNSSGQTSIVGATFSLQSNGVMTVMNNGIAGGAFSGVVVSDTSQNNPVVLQPGGIHIWSSYSFGTRVLLNGSGSGGSLFLLYDNANNQRINISGQTGSVRANTLVVRDFFNSTKFQIDLDGLPDFYGGAASSASAGFWSYPATCEGFVIVKVAGAQKKIPYFAM